MVNRGACLKNGDMLKWKRIFGQQLPLRVAGDDLTCLVKIRPVVRTKEKAAPLPCPGGKPGQKIRVEQAVLMVALFGPRVWEQHVNVRKRHAGGQFMEKVAGLTTEEMQIREAGAITFAEGLVSALQPEIDPNA
jgi:hypothetical protein